MRVELAVTNERGKWEEQSRRVWREQEQSLLTTAHQEWSKAQQSVMRAEVDRARREWERETDKTTPVRRREEFLSCSFGLIYSSCKN